MKRLPSRDIESLVSILREKAYAYCDVEGFKARLISALLGPAPPELAESSTSGLQGNGAQRTSTGLAGRDRIGFSHENLGRLGLTGREVEILRLVAWGKTNREIASELHISPLTVRTHLEHVYRKLGVGNRTEAAAFVLRAPEPSGSVRG